MKPSTRQAAVEHEVWARGIRRPELRDQDQGPEPLAGDQNEETRTKQQIQEARQGPRASSDTELQDSRTTKRSREAETLG